MIPTIPMRFFLSVLFLTLFIPCICPAQGEPKADSKDAALKAIAIFCENPFSEEAKAAAALVVNFSEKSPEVEINIESKSVPWFTEEPQPQHANLLLTAYIVGNTKSQLDRGKAQNDSLAGVLQAIATYQQIQKQEPDFKIPDVEKLIELNTRNKLKEYLETP